MPQEQYFNSSVRKSMNWGRGGTGKLGSCSVLKNRRNTDVSQRLNNTVKSERSKTCTTLGEAVNICLTGASDLLTWIVLFFPTDADILHAFVIRITFLSVETATQTYQSDQVEMQKPGFVIQF